LPKEFEYPSSLGRPDPRQAGSSEAHKGRILCHQQTGDQHNISCAKNNYGVNPGSLNNKKYPGLKQKDEKEFSLRD